jgi:hypothetical protein
MMNVSLQRYLLVGLGGVWCVLILTRLLTVEPPEEVPLTFVTGKSAAKTRAAVGAHDPWQVKQVSLQARTMPEGPKKNIFAPLGESTAVGARTIVAKRATRTPSVPSLQEVAAVAPVVPPGPTPEELAEQAVRQQEQLAEQAAQAARQQEELMLKQVREQMGQYRYLGYLNQQGVHKAFVGKGKDIYILRKGDKLDGKFLVASIDPTSVKLKEPTTSLEASIDLTKEGDPGAS